jgi:hypothetical protein
LTDGVNDFLSLSHCDSQLQCPASLDALALLGTSRRKVRSRERLAEAAMSLAYSLVPATNNYSSLTVTDIN